MAFGKIENPLTKINPNSPYVGMEAEQSGLIVFISNILQLLAVAAGLFAFFNLIIAGFTYISAGSDSKKTSEAWSRIYMSLIGLLLIVGSYAIAAIIGVVFFGDPGFILNPKIYGPGVK